MKKTILFVASTMTILFMDARSITASSQGSTDNSEAIVLTQTKDQTKAITRSFTYITVEAILDRDMEQVEISFDEPDGRATIQITSMGQVVSSYSCNTEDERIVNMPLPTIPGDYSLTIKTPSAEYTGYFYL